ncbi:hypothetical protein OG320_26625 [Microbispora sp. NBC_01189]|uniref:hypothetical protein n=1 Tax=Microbispora sp. NBC_01189 TaxID=2903583 RepID=UPI002E10D2B5|nr:hypothetical protein OG320_26625 [Microbispora sp. NBC_01189]
MRQALTRVALAVTSLAFCAGCGGATSAAPSAADPANGPAAGTAESPVTCDLRPRTAPGETTSWTHPAKSFYDPSDEDIPTRASLDHLLVKDDALVIEYSTRLPEASLKALREWTYLQTATVVLPGPDTPAVRAVIASTELVCDGVDTVRLSDLVRDRTFGQVADHGEAG